MFWFLLFVGFALVSILAVNPAPLILAVVLWAFARPVEGPLREQARAGGRNPDTPPAPDGATGCLALFFWVLAVGAALLILVGALGALVMEVR